jgi:YYY domain-containing protein
MIEFLSWYVAITLFGWLAWPLIFRIAPGLPDRGYTVSRALGLMLVGYVFWLLGSLGFLRNTVGGILFSALLVLSLSIWAYLSRPDRTDSLRSWIADHRSMLITAEVIFLLAFAAWAAFRAFNPEIQNTEKPMELMFLNGVRSSNVFPPRDSWLSGYAISYYYFGYILIAMLADITGVASEIAFNLGIALLFGLTFMSSYGLIYNLVAARRGQASPALVFSAILGPILLLIIGNLEGLFEILYARAIPKSPDFWKFIDLRDLDTAPTAAVWPPTRWNGAVSWPWWRASRVIRDVFLLNRTVENEVIDEFPLFSFLLGDMHPHVLALPFVLLALALAFNLLRQKEHLTRIQFGLYAIVFGALAFLNTWDFPIYLFILVAAMVVRAISSRGQFDVADLLRPVLTGLGIFAAGVIAYLPWYISFSSQAGGIVPNALFPTRWPQFLIMFGPFIFVMLWFLIDRAIRHGRHMDWGFGAILGGGLLLILFVLMLVMGITAMNVDVGVRNFITLSVNPSLAGQSEDVLAAQVPTAIQTLLRFRLSYSFTPLLLTMIIILTLAALLPRAATVTDDSGEPIKAKINQSNAFVLVLILTGAMLTLGPDFVYLRDYFGTRMNTIFKFYYAAWLLFSLASAYAAHEILSRPGVARFVFSLPFVALIGAALIYPALAIPHKANNFDVAASDSLPTLDGIYYIRQHNPQDYEGIQWLRANAESDSVILEAVGGPYSYYGRVSMATGLPTVMGWPGHERQWRGDTYNLLAGSREQDVEEIYNTPNMRRAHELIEKYGVIYVFVGSLEQGYSSAGLAKFDRYLPVVFRGNNSVIYRADLPLVEDAP